jgi:hypothetical protein
MFQHHYSSSTTTKSSQAKSVLGGNIPEPTDIVFGTVSFIRLASKCGDADAGNPVCLCS